jgi:hypothetical protein
MAEIEVLPKGTVLEADKICLDANDAKDIIIAYEIQKARNEAKDQIIAQFEGIVARKDEQLLAQDDVISQWKELAEELTIEANKRVKKEKTASFSSGLLWGIIIGGVAGYIAGD